MKQSLYRKVSTRTWQTVLVEPFKQLKLGAYVLGIVAVFTVALTVFFLKAFWDQYRHIMQIFTIVDPSQQWELVTNVVFYRNLTLFGTLLGIFFAVILTVIFKVTHRYYGPLVAIERFVDGLIEGDYTRRVVIRKGDELQGLVHKLNRMAEQLERRHGSEYVGQEVADKTNETTIDAAG